MTITETVTKKLKLFSRRKVVTLLSGNYDSLFRGRGLEIDNLREYVPGDDIKDIDWKATARTTVTHTRLYTALRDQRIIILADTSRSMLLDGYSGLNKQDALYAIATMLGAFVKHNQDLLGLCAADPGGKMVLSRFNNTTRHIEAILRTMDATLHTAQNANVSLEALGNHLLAATKKRSAVFIVTDSTLSPKILDNLLARLTRRHHVFYVQLTPSWPFLKGLSDEFALDDIESQAAVSPDIAASSLLKKEWQTAFDTWYEQTDKICRARGVPHGLVSDAPHVPDVLRNMFMQAKKYAIRRK